MKSGLFAELREYLYSEDSVEDDLKAVITEERFEDLVFPEQLGGEPLAMVVGTQRAGEF